MSIGYNPLAMIKFIMDSIKRTKELGIKSYNTKGENVASVASSDFTVTLLFFFTLSADTTTRRVVLVTYSLLIRRGVSPRWLDFIR